ncbi:MAG: hypothetical protein DI538_12005 [Azospira oryzae]|nr:MAG: hypothetical protein DI538_12005 [Azospira oryzae]
MTFNKLLILIAVGVMVLQTQLHAQSKYLLEGSITDEANDEQIVGATVFCKEIAIGVATDGQGHYSISVPAGNYTFEFSFIGYQKIVKTLLVNKNIKLNIQLSSESRQLNEVVVVATERENSMNVRSLEMSTSKLDLTTIRKLPALLGEVDVIKSLQFLPGVTQVGEGSSGFNVRGGSTGQNLVLFDKAPVYNSSHMLGFFSVFNPDVVKDVKLYKGAIPANFGGRTSSVLDVQLKEGSRKKYSVDGGVGLIFSRLSAEGPIIKDKASFVVGARRSYIDVLSKSFLDNGIGMNFYDVTAKADYIVDQRNTVSLTGFTGRDIFKLTDDNAFTWGNNLGTLKWNRAINDHFFANTSLVYSNYNYKLDFHQDDDNAYLWKSSINNYVFKSELNYLISDQSEMVFGAEGNYYRFNPARTTGVTNGEKIDNSQEQKSALEAAAFISHKYSFSPQLEVGYGVRLSGFSYLGAGTAYTFNDTIPGKRRSVLNGRHFRKNETIASYIRPEPRASLKYMVSDISSIKASYSRTAQYVHFISNTTASNPLNIWMPSTNNIQPSTADQYTLGYFTSFGPTKNYEVSAEAYYKSSKNEVDYINGADLLNNQFIEGDLLSGIGRAYGMEFYLQKKTGVFTGWVSYTLSRSELKVDGINRGKWYAARYDQTHNLKVVGMMKINERMSTTADFVFTTGSPTTYPDQRYLSQGYLIPYNSKNSRNDVRLSNYHRLDISVRLDGKTLRRNGKQRKMEDYWVFSVYNIYGRKNTFSTYFVQSEDRLSAGQVPQAEAHRVSIIGTMVPSISYNFKF